MCECGCSMGNTTYRLTNGKGCVFTVELYPGCRNCTAPPGIIIRRIPIAHWCYEEAVKAAELPSMVFDGATEFTIKCGPDPDEFVNGVVEQVKAGGFGKSTKMGDAIHDLADLVWDEVIHGAPEAIEMQQS